MFSRLGGFSQIRRNLRPSKHLQNSVLEYAYVNARVGALRGYLLKADELSALEGSKSLRDYIALLEHTSYRSVFSELAYADVRSVDNALVRHFLEFTEHLTMLSPDRVRPIIASASKKYEMGNIKAVLASKAAGEMPESVRERLYPANEKLTIRLLGAKDVDEAAMLLASEGFFLVRDRLEAYRDDGNIQPLLAAVDIHHFIRLWSETERLSGKDERIAKDIIGTDIDTLNLLSILRAKRGGYDAKDYIIPVAHRINPVLALKMTAECKTVGETIQALEKSSYHKVLEKGLRYFEDKDSLQQFEVELRRHLLRRCRDAMRGSPSNIGTVLGFHRVKEAEVENLRRIAVCVSEELPRHELAQLLT
ncbi:MAG: V-type ATPase subunit [Candidatus Altiarchaeota archaeon]